MARTKGSIGGTLTADGARLRAVLNDRFLQQKDAAAIAGITECTFSRAIRGMRICPKTARRLADTFGRECVLPTGGIKHD